MKKIFVILTFFVLTLTFFLPKEVVFAKENNDDIEEEIKENINQSINDLDLGEFEIFLQELQSEYDFDLGNNIKQLIIDIIENKKQFNFYEIFDTILKYLLKDLLNVLPMVLSIIIIAIFYGISSSLSSGFAKESTNKIIYLICIGAIITILGYSIITAISSAKKTIESMDKLISIVFPILLTFTSALGGISSVAVYQPMMTILTTVIIKIINVFIMPLIMASIVFSIVGNLSDNVKLDKLTKTTKSIVEWTLRIVFGMFVGFITLEGITGATFDTVTVKSTKFALSSYVPILGGYLSDGFDLVMASCVLIKNAVGLTAIILLFFIAIVPVLKILVLSLSLRLASAIIEPISDNKISDLLFSVSKNLILLVVVLLGFAFVVFIVIMLIIYTCNFGVL